MRNVTISLSDEVARWARVWAAEHDTSLSAMLSRSLEEMMERENRYYKSMELFLKKESVAISDGHSYPHREDLYDR